MCGCLFRWQEWETLWHMQLINSSKTMDLFGYQALLLLPRIVKELGSSFMWLLWLVFLQYVSLYRLIDALKNLIAVLKISCSFVWNGIYVPFLCLPKYFNGAYAPNQKLYSLTSCLIQLSSILEYTCCIFFKYFWTYVAYRTSLSLCLSNIWCMEVIETSTAGLLLDQDSGRTHYLVQCKCNHWSYTVRVISESYYH